MSRLNDLLRQVQQKNPQLATDLRREVQELEGRRAFGLNFERHTPETVELPGRPVRKGDKVRRLPERGQPSSSTDRLIWHVRRVKREGVRALPRLFEGTTQTPQSRKQNATRVIWLWLRSSATPSTPASAQRGQ